MTDASGGVDVRYDYLPFGEEIPAPYGGRTTDMKYRASSTLGLTDSKASMKFTSKERDAETGPDGKATAYGVGAGATGLLAGPWNGSFRFGAQVSAFVADCIDQLQNTDCGDTSTYRRVIENLNPRQLQLMIQLEY